VTASFLSFIFALFATTGRPATVRPVLPMSQEEMEVRVRVDAARTLHIDFENVQVVKTTPQIWPDTDLGCPARFREIEQKPTPGFLIVAKVKKTRVTYRTDRLGLVRRCDGAEKKKRR
jgi:hypothetical protein